MRDTHVYCGFDDLGLENIGLEEEERWGLVIWHLLVASYTFLATFWLILVAYKQSNAKYLVF